MTNDQISVATYEELATALATTDHHAVRQRIIQEAKRRKLATEQATPFNPKIDISADAQYLWKRIFIWFWVLPLAFGLLIYIAMHVH